MEVTDMFEVYNKLMNTGGTGLFKISLNDLGRGLFIAVLGPLFMAIVATLGSIILSPGFDVFAVNWSVFGHNILNTSIVASFGGFSGYISKQLLTSDQGNILGVGDVKSREE